jgi:hypothetical protein
MHRHRRTCRGLAAAVMVALGLWIFRGPMPGMVMGGALSMARGGDAAALHAGGAMPGHGAHGDPACGVCIGCCPGSSTPPPNPLGLRFDATPVVLDLAPPLAPALPRRAIAHHWQPQPIGPPAPHVS